MSAILSGVAGSLLLLGAGGETAHPPVGTIPIVYGTDLYHPHEDPDDHFDLATLFSIPEFEIQGILLDDGSRQEKSPGRIPVEQMMHLTGRKVRHAIGLGARLKSPSDDGRDQPARFQKGVALLLDVLRDSDRKVTVFTTGSLRDVAAAFNREPQLLRRKIDRLYINIGDSGAPGGGQEYNVKLDPQSYVCILRSGLPVYWCPCFDGGIWKRDRGYATYWQFVHEEALETAPAGLQNWFLYALVKPTDVDPIEYLAWRPDPEARRRVWGMRRNMWCTAPLLHAARRQVVEVSPGRWVAEAADGAPRTGAPPYDFVPARVSVDDAGRAALLLDEAASGREVQVFKIFDQAGYEKIMTSCLGKLFAELAEE